MPLCAKSFRSRWILWSCIFGITVTLVTLLVALMMLIWQSLPVFSHSGARFLTSADWYYPQQAFGALAMIYGTALVSLIALVIAVPLALGAAVFSGATLPTGIRDSPLLALPYHVFVLAQDTFNDDARANLWGAALVLVALVACFNLAALPLRLHSYEESGHV